MNNMFNIDKKNTYNVRICFKFLFNIYSCMFFKRILYKIIPSCYIILFFFVKNIVHNNFYLLYYVSL